MIARIAQHSFSKIQNCLENTISKMCANQTDRSRAVPSTPIAAASASFPGKKSPLQPCALHTSSVRRHSCRHSLPNVASCVGECRGESMSKVSTFLSCERFTIRVPRRSGGSLYEPWAFQELDENSVYKRVLAERLHHHHSLLSQHVQHPRDV